MTNQIADFSMDFFSLKGKVAIVTGGNTGLGQGFAVALAKAGADIFIGVSKADLLSEEDVKKMAANPIVFGLANPNPEIKPELAKKAGVAILATGRSDYPNQVNNAVAFPGIFRGALNNKVSKITDDHKIAAAEAIASLIDEPSEENIIPSVFDERLVPTIASKIN